MNGDDSELLAEQLRDAERGEAAGHTGYRHPAWLPWLTGAWVFSYLGGATHLDGTAGTVWILLHAVLPLGYAWWDHRAQAVSPRGRAPREFRVFYAAVVLAVVALVLVTDLALDLGGWVGAAVAGLGVALVGELLVRSYARASLRAKDRLA